MVHTRRHYLVPAGLMVSFLIASAQELYSQTVRGTLLDQTTGRPISGALVGLQDSTGAVVERRLTYSSGGFLIRASRSGRYRLEVLRIGFRPWFSRSFDLHADQVIERHIRLLSDPVVLAELVADADRCASNPTAGSQTADLLEEVRKAFLTTEATMRSGDFRFKTKTFRQRPIPGLGIIREKRDSSISLRVWPIDAAPADSLDAYGFVRQLSHPDGPIYYGIDGSVLLSETFLATHCFRIRYVKGPSPDRIGIAFEPVGLYLRPDVEGVFWVHPRTLAPRSLKYWYVGLPRWVPKRQAGGMFDFVELPNGGWVIRRWQLRAPIPKVSWLGTNPRLFGYAVEGGEVIEVLTRAGERLFDLQNTPISVETPRAQH